MCVCKFNLSVNIACNARRFSLSRTCDVRAHSSSKAPPHPLACCAAAVIGGFELYLRTHVFSFTNHTQIIDTLPRGVVSCFTQNMTTTVVVHNAASLRHVLHIFSAHKLCGARTTHTCAHTCAPTGNLSWARLIEHSAPHERPHFASQRSSGCH